MAKAKKKTKARKTKAKARRAPAKRKTKRAGAGATMRGTPAPAEGWGERRVPMLLADHHLRVLEELGRRYGVVTRRGHVDLERVLREILDRYGNVLLTVAQPRRAARDEEE